MTIATALTQSSKDISIFVIDCKFCHLLFWMGPKNTKGPQWGLFLNGFNKVGSVEFAFAAMHDTSLPFKPQITKIRTKNQTKVDKAQIFVHKM